MLVDEITIRATAGKGGDGTVAFNRNKMALGPTGARGGLGGSIFCEAIPDIGALTRLRNTKVFKAQDGGNGGHQLNDGKNGADLVIKIPIGTVIHDLESKSSHELLKAGERIQVVRGGRGGRGNFHFRSSLNTSPKQSQKGLKGESKKLRLELKLIANIGVIGLPNAGKSSLLNAITRAQSKVANYPFTTLEPNLGVFQNLILADIPGIIEGASGGKGLGVKFLRHIERTTTLFHLISCESEDLAKDYEIIRKELSNYSTGLIEKDEYVFLSKTDLVSQNEAEKKVKILSELISKPVTLLSTTSSEGLGGCLKILYALNK